MCVCVCVSTELFILSSWRDYKHGMVVASGRPSVGEITTMVTHQQQPGAIAATNNQGVGVCNPVPCLHALIIFKSVT
jgi:hypothetical protein